VRPYIYFLPVAVFLMVAVLGRRSVDLTDPRLVRRPGGPWTLTRVLRDEEWTPDGLVARRNLLRGMLLALGLGGLTWIAVLALAGKG
jgi:hypothetical protein